MSGRKITKVTAFGQRFYVLSEHLSDPSRMLLPLMTRDGNPWHDTPAGQRAWRKGEATMVHRDNIDAT